jgi:hypothetical protein
MAETRHAEVTPAALVGNRWVLVGGLVYLLEWVAIIAAGMAGVGEVASVGRSVDELLKSYVGNLDAVAFMAGWFAVVLLGRILIFVGLRQALLDSGYPHPLMDFAVVASAVSVTIEIGSYGLAAAAAQRAEVGDAQGMLLLDLAAGWMNLLIAGGLGVATVCAAFGMWRSGLFPVPLNVTGFVIGVLIVGAQLTVSPSLERVFSVLAFSPLVFWIWMLWAGVVCWRRTGPPNRAAQIP